MAKPFPKHVWIGGEKFPVVFEKMDSHGEFRYEEKQIALSMDCKGKELAWENLRHEMIHAALYVSGVGFMKKYQEDPIVRCMDNVFFPAWDKLRKK